MLRLATRASKLALAQSETVRQLLVAVGIEAELVPIDAASEAGRPVGEAMAGTAGSAAAGTAGSAAAGTAGSAAAGTAGSAAAGSAGAAPVTDKGRFTRGVEQALLSGRADIGVHSAKDLPSDLLDGLRLAGAPTRAEAADAFVGSAASLDALPEGARVGTASLRRRSQLLALRPDLQVEELRGNVDTRLDLIAERGLDGAVLAVAGLTRLGREDEISFRFGSEQMLPAAGQGTLALEIRADDEEAAAAVAAITDSRTWLELCAERALVAALDADCDTPVGARAALAEEGELELAAYVGRADGTDWVRDRLTAVIPADGAAHAAAAATAAERLGAEVAKRLLAAGADEILGRR